MSDAFAQAGKANDDTDYSVSAGGPTNNLTLVNSISVSNETRFLNYTDTINGIRIKYPSNWNIVLPNGIDISQNDSASINKVAKFSSPTRDNVTISIDRLRNELSNSAGVKEYINRVLNNSRNAFAEYRLLDLRISSGGSNLTMESNNSEFAASTQPVIYNLTYSAEQNDRDDRSHIIGMDIGALVNHTGYVISYQANVERYATYLPDVLEMIYFFEINDLNGHTIPKSSSSQDVIAFPPDSPSNATASSREQNTIIDSGAATSSPSSPNGNRSPSTPTQQTNPNYYTPPSPLAGSPYPTTQLYPPGYSPYPPPGYSPYSDYSLNTQGYSPYTGYLPYAEYSPYIVIDPIVPTPPIIPPVNYADPTISSYNTYNDTAGVFHVVGEVNNPSPRLVTSVQVVAAFYDSLNQILAFNSAYTSPPAIPPGQIAFFDLTIPPGTLPVDRVSQWTLRLVWQ